VILILLAAPLVLRIYGPEYAKEGTGLLRLLALSTLPNIIVALYLTLTRIQNRVRGVTFVQGTLSILLLGMSYLLLPIYGISGIGLAALLSQSCVALALLFTELPSILQHGQTIHLQERAALRRHL
jgi:O-antigen/teichoic acid export membrane protein